MNTKRIFTKQFKELFLVGLILILFSGISQGATHYVSPDGNYSWVESININTPCSPPTAMLNAVAGDVVYFRGGMYDVGDSPNWETPALNPTNSGSEGSPITFKAYLDETPIVKVSDSCSDCQAAIGSRYKNYIIWDGFTVDQSTGPLKWKGLLFNEADNCTVQNCIFIGKTVSSSDTVDGARLEDSANILVKNCKFYNYIESTGRLNTTAIKIYDGDYPVIENCEIYNCTVGIRPKRSADYGIYRYNYVHNCNRAFYATGFTVGSNYHNDHGRVYHNVFANNEYMAVQIAALDDSHTDDWQIYNNTIYNSVRGLSSSVGHSKLWNNIVQGCADNQYIGFYTGSILDESDHNQFGMAPLKIVTQLYDTDQGTYTSIQSWQNSGELGDGSNPGTGSLASDPGFLNSSGNMNQLNDFRLAPDSPCKGAGRNGGDMGADISQVGPGSPSSPESPPGVPPWFEKGVN
jgi:hypothetical protein